MRKHEDGCSRCARRAVLSCQALSYWLFCFCFVCVVSIPTCPSWKAPIASVVHGVERNARWCRAPRALTPMHWVQCLVDICFIQGLVFSMVRPRAARRPPVLLGLTYCWSTVCLTVFALMHHFASLCDSRKVMVLHCTSLIHGSTDWAQEHHNNALPKGSKFVQCWNSRDIISSRLSLKSSNVSVRVWGEGFSTVSRFFKGVRNSALRLQLWG